MNLVLEDAEEVNTKTKSRKRLGRLVCCFCLPRAALTRLLFFFFSGRILLKGDNITLLQSLTPASA
jgi:small nuclear ribonucleoprotein (snRNP)-like protein